MNNEMEKGRGMSAQQTVTMDSKRRAAVAYGQDAEEIQAYRAGAYGLLAALLRNQPDQTVLVRVAELGGMDPETDELSFAISMLGLSAQHCQPEAIRDEYHALFIGLGRGELVPYGSWYLTGFLMEKPLSLLRDDLARLGFERNADTYEPEDHIAALCEVMALLIQDSPEVAGPFDNHQSAFFDAHIGPWAELFFRDLSDAQSALFYRAVGRLGVNFMEFEKRYLSMNV